MAPVAPVAPVCPTPPPALEPACSTISNSGACAVSSFSLLSNCTNVPTPAVSANPLFADDPLTHPCTTPVTSNVTNSPAAPTWDVATTGPSGGSFAYVTPSSVQAPPSVWMLTGPAASARLQYNRSVALVICAAVVPAGNTPRSNCTSAVYTPPASRLLSVPALTPGCALETCASPNSVACCAQTQPYMSVNSHAVNAPLPHRLIARSPPCKCSFSRQC